jgi:P450-derived glycosyltransferase activator
MSDLSAAVKFAAQMYRQKTSVTYAGYLRNDQLARLSLRPGRADPYPIYERLRAGGPLTATRLGNWVTTSHRVCDGVLRDRRFGATAKDEYTRDQPPEEGFEMSFLSKDPPDHTRLRRLVTPAFSPKAVAGYAERIERIVSRLLDEATAAGQFDLVSAFAAPLPIAVISDLLGIPEPDRADFTQYGVVMSSALDGIDSLRHAARLLAASNALVRLFDRLIEVRRDEPADDVISHLVTADGDQVKPDEMQPICVLLLMAGFETTVNLIGNAVLALLGHPAQWEALCAAPAAMATKAVEETLRFDSPVQLTCRAALEPAELEGKQVRTGQLVLTLLGAANRDPEVYDHPATFDIGRENPVPHLAFSSGIHYCLGQPLARLEATIALRMLAERMPGLARAGEVTRRNGMTIRGPLRLPVRITG